MTDQICFQLMIIAAFKPAKLNNDFCRVNTFMN